MSYLRLICNEEGGSTEGVWDVCGSIQGGDWGLVSNDPRKGIVLFAPLKFLSSCFKKLRFDVQKREGDMHCRGMKAEIFSL